MYSAALLALSGLLISSIESSFRSAPLARCQLSGTITAFPTYLLLNPEGVVVARTSDLAELQQALAGLPLK